MDAHRRRKMITRRHLVKLLALTPLAPLVAWWTRRKHKPEPEPEYVIIQTVNQGTPEEHTTIHPVQIRAEQLKRLP